MSHTDTALPLSLYIHLPWCVKKCPYCDFNSHQANLNQQIQNSYIKALVEDFKHHYDDIADRTIETIFIGGGTPSLFDGVCIEDLIFSLYQIADISPNAEITIETNPGTADMKNYQSYFNAGVNRLSIGAQSFNDNALISLGRIHNHYAIYDAYQMARDVGFKNINIDLMYGLPQQTEQLAEDDLQQAIALNPEHISWYQLTIEPNTVFYSKPPKLPEDDTLWDIQAHGQKLLDAHQYPQYEISAYSSKPCEHNLNYWQFGDYLGIGAGAHSKLTNRTTGQVQRFAKVKIPESYQIKVTQHEQTVSHRKLTMADLKFEFMLNALRLKNGFSKSSFEHKTGLAWSAIATDVKKATDQQLLIENQENFLATDKGYQYLNDLIQIFIDEKKGE